MKTRNEFWVNDYGIGDILRISDEWSKADNIIGRVCIIYAGSLRINYLNHEFHESSSGEIFKSDIVRLNHSSDIKQYAINLLKSNKTMSEGIVLNERNYV